MKNDRSLYWTLLLYEESENLEFTEIKEKLKIYDYLYILHDKDLLPSGEPKKKHYHVVLRFKNYKWLNSLSEELGIPSNYFQKVRNLEGILCYLIHFKEENKHHYDIADVKGSSTFKNRLIKCLNSNDLSEEDKVSILFNYIVMSTHKISYSKFVSYVISKGLWSEFRRSASIFNKLLDEHNSKML